MINNDRGLHLFQGWLDKSRQIQLLEAAYQVIREAPLFQPGVPLSASGALFSLRITSCGRYGGVSDARSYRYERTHPVTGKPWPPMPAIIAEIAAELTLKSDNIGFEPQSCLLNLYREGDHLPLHVDRAEEDFSKPIVSISLGEEGVFLMGGLYATDPVRRILLRSGDCLVMSGESRNSFHGYAGNTSNTSTLLQGGVRLNLTVRQVTA